MKRAESSKFNKVNLSKYKYTILAFAFWLIAWQVISNIVDNKILLASPKEVLEALFTLIKLSSFWKTVMNSFSKIALGFISAVFIGTALALISCIHKLFREIISMFIRLIKAIPVASFVIVVLLWVESKNLSVLISFLMVIPIMYTNILKGIGGTDKQLLEMAKVFRVSMIKKIRYIYIPGVMPYFVTACSVGLGFCWKSGIAAELIGQPKNSIGAWLYEAKLYLMTKELFAWTIVIVVLSIFFEKVVMLIIKKVSILL